MLRKPKKPKRTTLKHKADRLFSLVIRHKGICEAKGLDKVHCSGILQCAHIVTRGHYTLRYDKNNALCLCGGHHYWYTNHPDAWYMDFIPTHFPDKYAYIKSRKEVISDSVDYEAIINELEKELKSF